jgi:hypothetical protein
MKKQAMKRSLFYLLACIGWVAVVGGYAVTEMMPNQVIHQNISCPTTETADAQEVKVLGTFRWQKGVVVLYSALCSTHNAQDGRQQVLGHQVVRREGINWQISSSDSYSVSNPQQASEKLIEYGVSQAHEQSGDRYTILYGQFLTPHVSTVEATFDNGEVLRADGRGKVFGLISVGAANVCELRILGPDNQLLRREDLSRPNSLFTPKQLVHDQGRSATYCLPMSHHL